MISSKKDREIWKDKCINLFQKKKHKGTTILRISDNLRVKFPNLREDLQICNKCRFELARIPNQVQ